MSVILAADVGGTKTNLGYFRCEADALTMVERSSVPTSKAVRLEAIVEAFVAEHPAPIRAACFGVAAPVVNGRSHLTNLPWIVEPSTLQRVLGLKTVWLINDLEATAYGISALPPEAFATLQAGQPQPRGTIAVIAAGTSLGEATLYWDREGDRALASEGGHADFAPRNALEWALCEFLLKRYARVSYARVLSGPGLGHIYAFLKATGRGSEPAWLSEELATGDPVAKISAYGLNGRVALCQQALDLFVSLYGAEAGNLALRTLPRGGLYVGGGIAPKVLQKLRDGAFLRAFTMKESLAEVLSTIPVHVILDDQAALYGAARHGWACSHRSLTR